MSKGESSGRNGKNFATLAQYFAIGRKSTQRREPLRKEAGTGSVACGRRKVQTPLSPTNTDCQATDHPMT